MLSEGRHKLVPTAEKKGLIFSHLFWELQATNQFTQVVYPQSQHLQPFAQLKRNAVGKAECHSGTTGTEFGILEKILKVGNIHRKSGLDTLLLSKKFFFSCEVCYVYYPTAKVKYTSLQEPHINLSMTQLAKLTSEFLLCNYISLLFLCLLYRYLPF